jgi:hypothetical protein
MQQTQKLMSVALAVGCFILIHGLAMPAVAESRTRKPASWEPTPLDGIGDPNLIGTEKAKAGHRPSRSEEAARAPYESPWEADANLCLGYSGMKTSADAIGSFASLLLQVHLSSGFTLDFQSMYAIRSGGSSFLFGGGGMSWFADREFVGMFLSANGGMYFGSALTQSIPAGRLLLGVRLHEAPMMGTVGFSAGPEVLLGSAGTALGLLFRVDIGLRL